MKKLIIVFFILGLALIGQAQVSKTINITAAGTLSTALTSNELYTVTNLTITGTIDARDFKTMRDAMPTLAILDLSGITIAAYNGTAGPAGVKAFLSPAIKTSAKTGLDDPLNRIRAQQIKMQVGTVVTTAYPANEIPEFAFCNPYTDTGEGKVSLKSVIIPSSVTSIGGAAFAFCSGLTSITIPSSVTSIGNYAFAYCSGLTSVTIPSSVTSIGEGTFAYCSGLTSVTIPSSVTSIGWYAFAYCSGLTSVTIPSSVTTIEEGAFAYCSGLTSITIPSSVTTIGEGAFAYCSGLTSINVVTTNQNYSGINGVLFDKNQSTLLQYPGGKTGSYTIPSSVTTIGSYAFEACSGLTSVTIPSSVTSIGWYAFAYCSGLTSINVVTTNQNYSGINGVLFDKNQIELIQCPGGKTGSYIIPSSVTYIGNEAFATCSGLTSVTIPSSVTFIGDAAFADCSGLTSIYACSTVPGGLSSLSPVFYNVSKTTCILYVPTGSKVLYQTADQWQDFTNIVEFTTAVPALSDGGSIQVYPNPVTDGFRIKGIEGISLLQLTDVNGKMLLTKQVTGNETITVNNLPQGMYIIKIITSEGMTERKLVKK